MNFRNYFKDIKQIDNKVLAIVKNGLKISLIFCLIASFILAIYLTNGYIIEGYYIGISVFKSSLFYMVGFIICGFAFNKILKEIWHIKRNLTYWGQQTYLIYLGLRRLKFLDVSNKFVIGITKKV